MARRNRAEEEVTLSALPFGIQMWGFWARGRGGTASGGGATFYIVQQDGTKILQQDNSGILQQ